MKSVEARDRQQSVEMEPCRRDAGLVDHPQSNYLSNLPLVSAVLLELQPEFWAAVSKQFTT